MTGAASDPWKIIAYEVRMLRATYEIVLNPAAVAQLEQLQKETKVLTNAVEESAVLHTRSLCDVFLPYRGIEPDDILLSRLFSDWHTDARYRKIKAMINELRKRYGTRTKKLSPCWTFNKMMAHPTTYRSTSDRDNDKKIFGDRHESRPKPKHCGEEPRQRYHCRVHQKLGNYHTH